MKVYIGCSLGDVPPEFEMFVQELREAVRARGCEVMEFLGKERGVPGEVFRHDTKQVLNSSIVVTLCDYPSTGLGYEICLALSSNVPVLALARRGVYVSRLIRGVDREIYQFKVYDSLQCILDEFDRVYRLLHPAQQLTLV